MLLLSRPADRWGGVRDEGRETDGAFTYLNHAAGAWPKAPGVVEAVAQALSERPSPSGRAAAWAHDTVAECRMRLANLMGVSDPCQVVLASGATEALNLALLGAGLKSGAPVVTTAAEHNSVLRPLHRAEALGQAKVTIVGMGEDGLLDAHGFDAALRARPRLVALTHASNVTGRVFNVAPLFARARECGAITLLDASQTLGLIPVRADGLGADIVAFTGHKGLCGPPGTGGLWVSPRIEIEQVIVGGTGVRSDLHRHPPEMPTRLEAGTPNVPAVAGLSAALAWLERNGDSYCREGRRLGRLLRGGLRSIRGVHLADGKHDGGSLGIVSFTMDGWSPGEAGQVLAESFGIVCRTGLHCAPLIHREIGTAPDGTIRFSVAGTNSDSDVEAALNAVERMAQ